MLIACDVVCGGEEEKVGGRSLTGQSMCLLKYEGICFYESYYCSVGASTVH